MAGAKDRRMIVGLDIGTSKVVAIVAEVASDGNSTRGGYYLYDTRGISNPNDWIKNSKPVDSMTRLERHETWNFIILNQDQNQFLPP